MSRRRHSSFKLRWSRYYQFLLEGQVFFLKLKAYTNRNEGLKEWELITEQTYKDAMKKGHQDNLVVVEEEIAITPVQPLTLIFNEIYQIDESDMRKAVMEGQESVRELRKYTEIPKGLEYKIFKRVMDLQLKDLREEYKEAM
ncbi:hypothetical protein [Clostridium sp. Cult3]|uniref:hypothetical protein n=1 Tax=Clostridium sp. Cult3 TaxID=2079004 RepID=UPI001F45DDDE|nr:hypothetical protein [Clostridium sp. Cult3]MCF6461468.1 hypothetical protein [Clostridium sp. Cult3]